MNFIGNLIWLICGGFFAAMGYIIGGLVLCLTVIGIPVRDAMFQARRVGALAFWQAGSCHAQRDGMHLGLFCNIIWLLCGGLYTAVVHLVFAFLLCITIIGIPFARQHLKLVELSLMPFGRQVI